MAAKGTFALCFWSWHLCKSHMHTIERESKNADFRCEQVITAAILTKVYCFVPSLLSYEYLAWYMREVSVSIVVSTVIIVPKESHRTDSQ